MAQAFMNERDAISAALASCYITLSDGNRYCFMQLYNFESKIETTSTEVPILGKAGKGHKATGWTGTFSGTAHYNQSILRKVLLDFKKTGVMAPFDIQVTNEDPSSSIGRQTIIHKHCLLDGGTLAKFDADTELLDEEVSGTFDDWEMPEQFSLLPGMV